MMRLPALQDLDYTYRAHDGCLPVELSLDQYMCSQASAPRLSGRNRSSRGDFVQRVTYQVISDGTS